LFFSRKNPPPPPPPLPLVCLLQLGVSQGSFSFSLISLIMALPLSHFLRFNRQAILRGSFSPKERSFFFARLSLRFSGLKSILVPRTAWWLSPAGQVLDFNTEDYAVFYLRAGVF